VDEGVGVVRLSVDGCEAVVDVAGGGKVACAEPGLRARLEKAVARLAAAVRPVPVEGLHE
jgi:cleavage and polyadenylation specificity factor subunit 3